MRLKLHLKHSVMTITENNTNYFSGLVSLYHLLINADGFVNDKEIALGIIMKEHEGIEEWEFNYYLDKFSEQEKDKTIDECLIALNNCDYELKIKCIAWMSLIANSDGFMSCEEWKLIYYIYNTKLNLNLTDILEIQKQLPKVN